mmetsp:Transcript_88440/g.211132  ORF Transcript_88440/g.211132 Transcript_88440/m.211132 type:complete len:283 (-) Transcript_88440:1040-1888(-)
MDKSAVLPVAGGPGPPSLRFHSGSPRRLAGQEDRRKNPGVRRLPGRHQECGPLPAPYQWCHHLHRGPSLRALSPGRPPAECASSQHDADDAEFQHPIRAADGQGALQHGPGGRRRGLDPDDGGDTHHGRLSSSLSDPVCTFSIAGYLPGGLLGEPADRQALYQEDGSAAATAAFGGRGCAGGEAAGGRRGSPKAGDVRPRLAQSLWLAAELAGHPCGARGHLGRGSGDGFRPAGRQRCRQDHLLQAHVRYPDAVSWRGSHPRDRHGRRDEPSTKIDRLLPAV